VKVIKKTLTAKEKASLAREIDIMRQVRHPNIILVNEIYETAQQLFLVMEMASGGELFNEIVARGKVCICLMFVCLFVLLFVLL